MGVVIAAFLLGLLFGVGLLLSGLADPGKVLAFLDIAGAWDPSLLLVMGAAVAVAVPAFTWARRRRHSLLGEPLQLPANRHIDSRLLLGGLLFGIGWGLAGICPGPALILLGSGLAEGALFVLAMLGGMVLFEGWRRYAERRAPGVGA